MDLKMVTTTSAPNTNVEYDGDNLLPLAEEIDAGSTASAVVHVPGQIL